ncbi:hypothetical protein EDD17DRAFT_1568316 [Pisolithus thermaeus]|nr:hypothetical protein EDD17DRAFT_1568316 [Pisolithus thermaeus]
MPCCARVSVPHYHSWCDSVDTVKGTQRSFCSNSDRLSSVKIRCLTIRVMLGQKLGWPSERGRRRLTYVTCPSPSNEMQQIMTGAVIGIEQAPRSRLASRTSQNVGYTRKLPAFEDNAGTKLIDVNETAHVNHWVCGIVEHEKVHPHVLVHLQKLLTSRPNDLGAIAASRLLAMTPTNFMYVSSCRQIHRAQSSRGSFNYICPVHLVPALTE